MEEAKSLKDVWEWKEKIYKKTEKLKKSELIEFFNRAIMEFKEKFGLQLKVLQRT